MTEQQLIKLAYAAYVADRTAHKPIRFERWQDLPAEEQKRYKEMAKAVVREYQFILAASEFER